MNDQLAKLVENDLSIFSLDYFSVILGISPSKGARSPLLWNKVYNRERKNIQMIPLDVRPENIKAVFELLECNPKCLGGAIAVPYKETIFKFIEDQLPENIKQIGAVNCFYRQKKDSKNKFTGTNTDGEAALDPIYDIINDRPTTIAVLGFGGAGTNAPAVNKKMRIDIKHIESMIDKFKQTDLPQITFGEQYDIAFNTKAIVKEWKQKIIEGRGRPSAGGDTGGDIEHIQVQLRKVINLRGAKPVEFQNGKKVTNIKPRDAEYALKKINDMRGANDKHKAVKYIFAKPENLAKFIKDKESY